MSIKTMADLLKQQEAERQDLAVSLYEAWQPVMKKREEMLLPYGGVYENATDPVREEIDTLHKEFTEEWGSDGKLAVLMTARHAQEREKLIERQNKIEQLHTMQHRPKDKDRGR
ncbi:hypothetical protein [Niastella populi]|uniref:Uncharacterized protein n=1 Tax=Niastella populi TaxID=550983 RepID=A0A1V9ET74_9BACT|nr:hypothetical protein [Niastella populi]OQP49055.1 hypothetical protein A4R26_31060 [Niastella populi]